MKRLLVLSIAIVSLLSIGCATVQPPVPLAEDFWEGEKVKVGLNLTNLNSPSFYQEGSIALIPYGINAAAMSSVSSHIKSLSVEEFNSIKSDLVESMAPHGIEIVVFDEKINEPKLKKFKDSNSKDTVYFAKRDFRPLAKKIGADYLLSLNVIRAGVARQYADFIPLQDPRSIFEVHGRVIDLKTNELLWFSRTNKSQFVSGEWDEPPTFPGLTTGYYASLEAAREDILFQLKRKAEDAEPKIRALNAGQSLEDGAGPEEMKSE